MLRLDRHANEQNLGSINDLESIARIYVLPSEEEKQIARHALRLLES